MAATAKRPEIIEIARGLKNVPMCEDYEKMISGMMYLLPQFHHSNDIQKLTSYQVQPPPPDPYGGAPPLPRPCDRLQQPRHKEDLGRRYRR
jgi:hypothetical protein